MADRNAPGPLALVQELVNTLDLETGEDALGTPEALAKFVRARGLTGLGLAGGDLPRLHTLRETLRAACLAHTGTGTGLPRAQKESLAALLDGAPLVLGVDAEGTAALRPAPGLTGVPALTARIAAAIAAPDDGADWRRLKACGADDCLWVFYDRSPAGRGRWCSMAVCGSRAKMRAYRAKQRGS